MWLDSEKAIEKYLADRRPDGLWYGYADMNTGARTHTYYGALDAFFPAVLVLGNDTQQAVDLQDSSFRMWNLAGIEPEQLDYAKMKITAANYGGLPAIIESTYYLYHATHNPKYQAMGKTYFDALVKYCRTDEGYAALSDVRTKAKKDSMESFFFPETLKYLYLLFATESTLDFNAVIFNTEAHPMKRSGGDSVWGAGRRQGNGAGNDTTRTDDFGEDLLLCVDWPRFSLTPPRESSILETLRGVAPGVCVAQPGPSWLRPLFGVSPEQATGC